jgi:FkbM family methyltransferase
MKDCYVKIRKLLIGTGIGKLPLVTPINNFVLSHLKQNTALVFGKRMYLDEHDGLELSLNGMYEPMETETIRKIVKRGDSVLDVGAHIGYYSLILSDLVGKEGRVFAFEPDSKNFALLKKNVEINDLQNVTIVNKAVSDKSGSLLLYNGGGNSQNPTVGNNGGESTKVPCVSIDSYFDEDHRKIDFVKMDIEGSELFVLKGMEQLLQKNPHIKLIVEFYPLGLSSAGVNPKTLLGYLKDRFFTLYNIDEETGNVYPIDIAHFLEEYTVQKKNATNLLCVREVTL